MARNDIKGAITTGAEAVVAAADTLSTSAAATNSPAVAETIAAVADVAQAVEHISFDQWWMMMSKRLKLKAHIKEILHADFTARGLGKTEPQHKFESAMKLFGYKW